MKAKIITLILLFVLILPSCGKTDQTGNTVDDIKLKDNQRVLTGQIKEIYGNEIVVAKAEEAAADGFGSGGPDSGQSDSSNAEDVTNMPGPSDSNQRQRKRTMYTLTGDEEGMTIPVGTKVTTMLGTSTTFSRLAVSDMVKVVMESDEHGKETVIAIWIVG